LSYLFSKTSPLSFVVAHHDLLAIEALQITDLRSLANALWPLNEKNRRIAGSRLRDIYFVMTDTSPKLGLP
ncbi:MAG: hypothetical protein WCF56_01830, partial [Pseudolabrys sp.]